MIWCHKCQKYTRIEEPIILRKQDNYRYHVRALCSNCKWTVAKYLSNSEMRRIPDCFHQLPLGHNYMKYLVLEDGRIIELFPLLNPILN